MANKTEQNEKKGINPLTAGAVGLVAGAIGTAAVAMTNKKVREEAKKGFETLKTTIQDKAHEMKANSEENKAK